MYLVKIIRTDGTATVAECLTQATAREVVSNATLRMVAGLDGIADVITWEA